MRGAFFRRAIHVIEVSIYIAKAKRTTRQPDMVDRSICSEAENRSYRQQTDTQID